MKQNGLFFLDILSIVPPKGTRCLIQAPGIEGLSSVLSKTDDPAIMVMDCNKSTIEIIKNKIINSNIQDNIMYISIKNNDDGALDYRKYSSSKLSLLLGIF